ncbi:phage tail tape measure protein [Paenibacillus sp. RC84]|uniref:phage tail tape measure protein n=1 Tax=Paenibacillus sp. RC84 TaxID=3156252 RepID=UPI0035178054
MGVIGNLMFAVGFKVADSALSKADKQVGEMQSKWMGIGVAAAAVGAAIVGVGAASMSAASNMQGAMSSIQGATGQTAQQMEATKAIATDLYNQNFGQNWDDLGNAIKTTAQITQQQGDELKTTTKNALLLRDTFGFEVTESVKTSDTMMKQFGITSTEAMNLLADGAQKGLDKSGELMDTANEYSNQFKSLGFTANEMFDTLAAGSENGAFNLDKVGDAVKEFNIRAKDGSKTTTEAFQMLGLDADKMAKTFAAGGPQAKQAFQQVLQMIGSIEDPVQRNTVGVALMGSQFEDLEARTITAMGTATQQFDMTKNKMDELNQIKFDKPGEALAMFGRQMETGLLVPLGEKLMPYFNQFGQWLVDNQPTIQAVGAAIGDGLGKAIDGLVTSLGFIINNIDIIGPAIIGVAGVILYTMVPSMVAAATAGWAMIAPWLPIIAVALLVGLAIAGIILIFKNWGAIATWLGEVWTGFKTWVMSIFNSVVEFFVAWGVTIMAVLLGAVAWVIAAIATKWEEIKTTTVNIFTGIWNWLTNTWNNIVNSVSSAATSIWNKIKGVWDQITGFLGGINLFDIGKNIIEGMVNGIGSMANAVVDKVKEIGNSITDKVKSILGIHSPSRVMMELGFYTGEGLALGLDNTQSRVGQASSDLSDEIVSGQGTGNLQQATAATLPPARAAQGGDGTLRIEVVFKSEGVSGTALDGGLPPESVRQIEEAVAGIIEKTGRRSGLSTGGTF